MSKPIYEIEIVMINKGSNLHFKRKVDTLQGDFNYNSKNYKITPSNLFVLQRNFMQVLQDSFRGIKHRFMVVYNEHTNQTLEITEKKENELKSSSILYDVETNEKVSQAMKSPFMKHLTGRNLLGAVLIVGAVLIAILILTGNIDLSRFKLM